MFSLYPSPPGDRWCDVRAFVVFGSFSSSSIFQIFRDASHLGRLLFPPVCLFGQFPGLRHGRAVCALTLLWVRTAGQGGLQSEATRNSLTSTHANLSPRRSTRVPAVKWRRKCGVRKLRLPSPHHLSRARSQQWREKRVVRHQHRNPPSAQKHQGGVAWPWFCSLLMRFRCRTSNLRRAEPASLRPTASLCEPKTAPFLRP